MDANQYKTELHRWRDVNRQNLIDLTQWAAQTALPWLWAELAGILGKGSLDPLQPMHAIRQGLQTTPADRETMPLRPTFYHAHLTMLDSEARKCLGSAEHDQPDLGIAFAQRAGECSGMLPASGIVVREDRHALDPIRHTVDDSGHARSAAGRPS